MSLKNKWIVITRPKHQAEQLRTRLEKAGANVILFPLLEITQPDDPTLAEQQLTHINRYDLVIFTSANAVNYSLQWLKKSNLNGLKVAAIGKKTASLLKDKNIHVDYFPSQEFNSEALLALPQIQAYGDSTRAAVIRGQGGRDYLRQKLEKQGVIVDYIDVYKRILPQKNAQLLSQHYHKNQLDIILITSGSSLQNLFKFFPENKWLASTKMLLGSKRINLLMLKILPKYQGELLVTPDPSDESIYQKLVKWGEGIS